MTVTTITSQKKGFPDSFVMELSIKV